MIKKGIYIYENALKQEHEKQLPTELIISDKTATEAILIRLLCGTLDVYNNKNKKFKQRRNYSSLEPSKKTKLHNKTISNFFLFDNELGIEEKLNINKYIKSNRKNHFIHEEVLSELTSAILLIKDSPIESFVHIYRTLEFISYPFPLIYASKSMDYKGSYESLKKFMAGDSVGELNFLRHFLIELFKNNMIFNYEFDILFTSSNITYIKEEFEKIFSNIVTFENTTMKIKFANIADLLITLRNRYFHMLIGSGVNNFCDIRYDKREIFYTLNPLFINWLTIIYQEIVNYSVALII